MQKGRGTNDVVSLVEHSPVYIIMVLVGFYLPLALYEKIDQFADAVRERIQSVAQWWLGCLSVALGPQKP